MTKTSYLNNSRGGSWGGPCDPPKFDQEQEAEDLLICLISRLKTMGLEVRTFTDLGVAIPSVPVIPARLVPVTLSNDTSRLPFAEYAFFTVTVPYSNSHLTFARLITPLHKKSGEGMLLLDLLKIDMQSSVTEIMNTFDGLWPVAWRARAYRKTGLSEVYLELYALPYKLRELSSVIRPGVAELPDLFFSAYDSIAVSRSSLTERTPASQAFDKAVRRRMTPLTTLTSRASLSSTDFAKTLEASITAILLASRNWEQFKDAMRDQENMECIAVPTALNLPFDQIVSQVKPNGHLWFTSSLPDENFTVFYDLFYGHTSVHVLPQAFQLGGLSRLRHDCNVLQDSITAQSKKPRTKKQTVVVEKSNG